MLRNVGLEYGKISRPSRAHDPLTSYDRVVLNDK